MWVKSRIKIRLFLATVVLGLLLVGPVVPRAYAGDECPTSSQGSCTG